jgi:hypothetical protein
MKTTSSGQSPIKREFLPTKMQMPGPLSRSTVPYNLGVKADILGAAACGGRRTYSYFNAAHYNLATQFSLGIRSDILATKQLVRLSEISGRAL